MKYLIKEKRQQLGLKQKELAEMLNVTAPTLANWETGVAEPRAKDLPGIAKALNCRHIDDLYPEEVRP